MASEWAMEKTKKIVEHWDINDSMEPLVAEALDAARAQGRREGLEEAARTARSLAEYGQHPTCLCVRCLMSGVIESVIRIAITKEPKA